MRIDTVAVKGDDTDAMRATLAMIGQAIRRGSRYLPIRNRAAALASTASPKDYLGQVRAIYDDFIKHWRYVKDPVSRELLSNSPEVLYRLVWGADGIGAGMGKGVGDCDCVASALGAALESIGVRVLLGTTADPRAPRGGTFGHVFVMAKIPKLGLVPVDPVLHPKYPFGAIAPHSRIAFWDLDGRFLRAVGNYEPPKKKEVSLWHTAQRIYLMSRSIPTIPGISV